MFRTKTFCEMKLPPAWMLPRSIGVVGSVLAAGVVVNLAGDAHRAAQVNVVVRRTRRCRQRSLDVKPTVTVPPLAPAVVSLMPTVIVVFVNRLPPANPVIEPLAVMPAEGVPKTAAGAYMRTAGGRVLHGDTVCVPKLPPAVDAAKVDRRGSACWPPAKL